MDRDEVEVRRMLKEAARMETMEPPSEKRRVRRELERAYIVFAGRRRSLPAQPDPRGYSAQPLNYDPATEPWSAQAQATESQVVPMRELDFFARTS